jgi:SAM-dependent methyltransferase
MPECKACESTRVRDRGPLPVMPPTFGGEPCTVRLEPGRLWQCLECDLYFRFPYLSQAELTALYQNVPDTVWSAYEDRHTWPDVRRVCEAFASEKSVLDIGCFSGEFLAGFPGEWTTFGIEPSRAAREAATTRGVRVVADSLESADPGVCRVGAITLLDVFEHVERPLALLAKAASYLASGGCIVIVTGATDSWPFRLYGNHYWYCSLWEHVSFGSHRWFAWAARQLQLTVVDARHVASEAWSLRPWVKHGGQVALYGLVNRARDSGIELSALRAVPRLGGALDWQQPPWWKESRDHLLVGLKAQG